MPLSYHDVEDLRQESGSIDQAVSSAVAALKKSRPNLFKDGGASADANTRHIHELDLKVEQLQKQMTADMATVSKQMEELKQMILTGK